MVPITSPQIMGKVLRRYRKDLGFSQSKVGEKFNISQKVVSNIESGRPGVNMVTVFKYMSALGLEMHLEARSKSLNDEAIWK